VNGEARIDPAARIGADVEIGAFTTVHGNVEIGDGARIAECCVIGAPARREEPLRIGPGAVIRSHSVLYEGTTIGAGLMTGHHVLIREDCVLGEANRIGTQSALETGLRLGDYVDIQGYSVFGMATRIGDFAFVFPQVVATTNPLPPSDVQIPMSIGAGSVVCAGNILYPGLDLGFGAFVSSGADPRGTIPPAAVVGAGGRVVGPVTRLRHWPSGTVHPWMNHIAERYPPAAQERIALLREQVLAAAADVRPSSRRRA